jgi:hypothetical protein
LFHPEKRLIIASNQQALCVIKQKNIFFPLALFTAIIKRYENYQNVMMGFLDFGGRASAHSTHILDAQRKQNKKFTQTRTLRVEVDKENVSEEEERSKMALLVSRGPCW